MPSGKGPILGRSTLSEVHADEAQMSLPSWIGRISHNLGSASHGTLSADQWWTAAAVNAVVSLVRLWALHAEGNRSKLILDNFMELPAAIKLANLRVSNPQTIEGYNTSMTGYISKGW